MVTKIFICLEIRVCSSLGVIFFTILACLAQFKTRMFRLLWKPFNIFSLGIVKSLIELVILIANSSPA